MVNFIYGLGGRDLSLDQLKEVFRTLDEVKTSGVAEPVVHYIGVRE